MFHLFLCGGFSYVSGLSLHYPNPSIKRDALRRPLCQTLAINMKNHINIAETCLYLLSFFSFVGVVYAFIDYGTLTGSPQNNNVSFLGVVVIPSIISLLFGFAFHFCAKYIKLGSTKAWKYSVALLVFFLVNALLTLLIGSIFFGWLSLIVICVGLWALLQKGTREFIKSANVAS